MKDEKIKKPYKEFIKNFLRRKIAVLSLLLIVLLILIGIFQPITLDPDLADYDNLLAPPSYAHWFGTDEYGRDLFNRIIVGTRLSLAVSLSSVFIGTFIGTLLGLVAGFYGGKIESIIMRSCDVLFSFPGLLLAIGIVAIIGPGLINIVVAISIYGIPSFTRIVRSSTLSIKKLLYIEASKSIGVSNFRILFIHIFPGTLPTLIVTFTMRIGTAIISAASLSFLGFGASPTKPDWGAMLSTGRDYIGLAPHMLFYPGLMIFLTVLAFNLLGDGLRDTLDPKLN
ncbi:ABC transporter permease subunit [Psychrilyobacter sp.]|uniref:ABC transporter permease subunit n=1 Tax=Psychrilyobacter sp. TaxID=2586924 RepID=UPI00301B208F